MRGRLSPGAPRAEALQWAGMRDYHYRVDGEGRVFHDGTEIVDPPTLRFFLLAMTRDADGRWLAVCQGERNWFEADPTPFVVQRLQLAVRDGLLEQVELRLAGDYRERLDPGTLEAAGDRLACRVRRGAFPARLGRVATQQLAPFLVEEAGGVTLVMRHGRHPLRGPAGAAARSA
jgi:hypothetical protein